jgi:hypothetical protein
MAKQLHLTALIDLPENPFHAALVMTRAEGPWVELLKGLDAGEVPHKATCEVLEQRAKAKRGPRKPKLGLVTPPAGEAA